MTYSLPANSTRHAFSGTQTTGVTVSSDAGVSSLDSAKTSQAPLNILDLPKVWANAVLSIKFKEITTSKDTEINWANLKLIEQFRSQGLEQIRKQIRQSIHDHTYDALVPHTLHFRYKRAKENPDDNPSGTDLIWKERPVTGFRIEDRGVQISVIKRFETRGFATFNLRGYLEDANGDVNPIFDQDIGYEFTPGKATSLQPGYRDYSLPMMGEWQTPDKLKDREARERDPLTDNSWCLQPDHFSDMREWCRERSIGSQYI